MDTHAIRAEYDRLERRGATVPGMLREASERSVRLLSTGTGRGIVLHSELDSQTADAEIDAVIARFRELGQAFEWKLHSHDQPADLRQRLAARGFAHEPAETLLAIELARELPAAVPGVVVRILEERGEFDLLLEIHRSAFGKGGPGLFDGIIQQHARAPETVRVHFAWIDGEPVAAGWMYLRPDTPFASLWSGGTVHAFRRRGAYRALVASRLAEARERGYRHALVDAAAPSLPILRRLGFEEIATMRPMTWRPPAR